MRKPVIITPGLPKAPGIAPWRSEKTRRQSSWRWSFATASVALMSVAITMQLINLAWRNETRLTTAVTTPIAQSYARPDIVDRRGRLLATDVQMPSLYADPTRIVDRNIVVEHLTRLMPDLDAEQLRADLADRTRQFVWIRRGLAPNVAQHIHDLGLPGLNFKQELRRAYPSGKLAGHLLGAVNVDNKGIAGLERYIDTTIGVDAVLGADVSGKPPLQTSLDLGAQHALTDELKASMRRYKSKGAAGVVLDVDTGEVLAATSLPGPNPMQLADLHNPRLKDKLSMGSFELGSVFKAFTVAMALESGSVTKHTRLDVAQPLVDGRHVIRDSHDSGRQLSVAEVFTHSSNVGAGLLALAAGPKRQKAFLKKFKLLSPVQTELGATANPQLPQDWQRIQQITVSYGHGIAVAPLQFAAAAAALVNGGRYFKPTFLHNQSIGPIAGQRVLSESTSRTMRELMRLNVTERTGTGRRADVPGYEIGGKTGTAEIAVAGRYRQKKVISSFVAAFPMRAPRYLVLVSLFEPKATRASGGAITAGRTAAPTVGRIIRRIAPLLNVAPVDTVAALNP